ncbi:cytidine deaminase [Deinococcus irradiatisoli]|uniref:Cytidine deaminase n=1 Tax=Deinococcus irradiatisoli TaxID=2202254 RepID=A0A2Z3JS99_9DEIO|nr:cytidine deaminase [Deinococcus irradiatisoli]AWN23614.1 cytidine deaminase [Deinococcus irradiatisoli]
MNNHDAPKPQPTPTTSPAPQPDPELLAAAKAAFENAYAPYSRFRVGAALRTPDGRIFSGANVENASYGLGRCAEQSAIQAMASAGERTFSELVVYADAPTPATPCGACRQVLFEFSPAAQVFCVNTEAQVLHRQVADFLPYAFQLEEG